MAAGRYSDGRARPFFSHMFIKLYTVFHNFRYSLGFIPSLIGKGINPRSPRPEPPPFFFPPFFRCLFASILAPFCLPTWPPKPTKIKEKWVPRCLPMLTSFFDRFLLGFCSQLRPPEPQKSSPRCSESTIFQKIAFRTWHRFLIDFGANLAPFCLPKSTKILPKIDSKRH